MSVLPINNLQWANLDFLDDVAQLKIHLVEDGIDNLALLRFEAPAAMLPSLLISLGIKQPLRPGYRPMPDRIFSDPSWWVPYSKDKFSGAQGLTNGLGREIIAHELDNAKEIYLRTYQL